MSYFYVLENEVGDLYYGATCNLKRRVSEHTRGAVSATRGHQWTLIYYEAYRSETDARNREQQVKQHGQAKRWLKQRIRNSRQS